MAGEYKANRVKNQECPSVH